MPNLYLKRKDNDIILTSDTEFLLNYYNEQIHQLEIERSKLYKNLQSEMEKNNIKKIETDKMVVNYIDETTVEWFDKKALKEEDRKTYNKYCKLRTKSPYIMVKIRKEETDDNENDQESFIEV